MLTANHTPQTIDIFLQGKRMAVYEKSSDSFTVDPALKVEDVLRVLYQSHIDQMIPAKQNA